MRATGAGLVGLHLKGALRQVVCLLSLGTGKSWEGQSLQGQQKPQMSKHQNTKKAWLIQVYKLSGIMFSLLLLLFEIRS